MAGPLITSIKPMGHTGDPTTDLMSDLLGEVPPEEAVEPPQQAYQYDPEEYAGASQDVEETIMSEAQRRIAKATLWQTLIMGGFFSDQNDLTQEVETEIMDFAEGKLQELLGMKSADKTSEHFTDDQIQALKLLADKLLTSNVVLPKEEPKVVTPPKRQAPVVTKPVEPQVKKHQAPKPMGRPVSKVQKETKVTQPKKPAQNMKIPGNETKITEGGREFRVVHHPIILENFQPNEQTLIKQLKVDSTVKLIDGTWIGCIGPSNYIKISKFPLAMVNNEPGAAPALSLDQFQQHLENQAIVAEPKIMGVTNGS